LEADEWRHLLIIIDIYIYIGLRARGRGGGGYDFARQTVLQRLAASAAGGQDPLQAPRPVRRAGATVEQARYSAYLRHWYKSTNTDAAAQARYSAYLRHWYKSTNTDAAAAQAAP
jgi:hypothetical protein